MSHNSRNKQLKLFEISITGLFSIDTAEETKANTHVFRQREMCSTHVGPERRTSTCFPPVMRSWLFGFSLTFWRPRRRPRSRRLKSLLPPLRRTCPIHLHLCILIFTDSGSVLLLLYSSSFEIWFGQKTLCIFLMHFLWKASSLFMSAVVILHISAPYSKIATTQVLVFREY